MSGQTTSDKLEKRVRLLLVLFLSVAGLYYAQSFLKPICFAILLAMLLLPMTKKLEQIHFPRSLASFVSVLTVTIVIACVGFLLWWQVSGLAESTGNIEQTFDKWKALMTRFAYDTFGLTYSEQEKILNEQQSAITAYIPTIVEEFIATCTKIVLILVYAYMLLIFRRSLKRFILHVSPSEDKEKTKSILNNISQVSIKYLSGLLKLIVTMTVLYSLGYWIIGVKNPIFFAGICGMLELIPFLGNLVGSLITSMGAIAQTGSAEIVPLVFVVYFIVQFLQSYILEPLILGSQVNLNPLFSILALIAGEVIWGIAGMVLAIPILGIVKIYFDHHDHLKSYGQLLGADTNGLVSPMKRVRSWIAKLRGKKK